MPTRERFAVVKVRFDLPAGIPLGDFSRTHPEAVLHLRRFQVLPAHRILAEWDYFGPSDPAILEEVRRLPDVISASPVALTDSLSRAQLVTEQPNWLALEDELRVLYRHPIVVQNGEVTLEVAAPVSRLDRLLESLRRLKLMVRVVRFGRDPLISYPPTLTTRQRTLLVQALAAGYFDVPRRISLTDLAEKLHRSKSTLSQVLRRVQQRLAEASAGPPAPPRPDYANP